MEHTERTGTVTIIQTDSLADSVPKANTPEAKTQAATAAMAAMVVTEEPIIRTVATAAATTPTEDTAEVTTRTAEVTTLEETSEDIKVETILMAAIKVATKVANMAMAAIALVTITATKLSTANPAGTGGVA